MTTFNNIATALLISLVAPAALATDKFSSEVICQNKPANGSADQGLEIHIQSNPYAWVKRAAVIENGYMGPREIGSFQIPLHQPKVSTPSYFDATRVARYEVKGFVLEMAVADREGQQVLGPAMATIELSGYEPMTVELHCQLVP